MKIPYRNPIVHDTDKSSFPGPYELTDLALKKYNVEREKFGSTEILIPSSSFTVKDYQYKLPDGKIGMHFVPISDTGNVLNPKNENVPGSSVIDAFLRERMQLKEDEPIYAFVNYFHPEQNKGDIRFLATKTDKIEMGFTHLGGYYGQGYTTNAPMLYHGHRFGVDGSYDSKQYGYPANVQVISMEGVPQATLNKNFRYVDTCLNSGVMFPNKSAHAYMDSAQFRVIDINTALMFYRDWIKFEGYLRKDDSWYPYCAAHKTIVSTVALNLPHNLKSFQEVYGKEGEDLFNRFKLFYNIIVGPDPGFLPADETDFEPLWKKEGLTSAQISPFTYDEYYAYDKARRARALKNFKGKRPLKPDQATCWAPQSSAEVIFVFMQVYSDMLDAGSIIASASILAFMKKIDARMGISKSQYLLHAMPIINRLMIADASMYAVKDPDNYLKNAFTQLCLAFNGNSADAANFEIEISKVRKAKSIKDFEQLIEQEPPSQVLAAWSLLDVINQWDAIVKAEPVTPIDAYVTLMESIQADLEKAREMLVTEPDKIQFNTPPTTTHLLSNGMHKTNPRITVKEVCTIIDSSEIQLKAN